MAKIVNIKLGYYKSNYSTFRQINFIEKLMEEKGYKEDYNKHIIKYGLRNPTKRINKNNASKLIKALLNNNKIYFEE